MYFFLWRPCLHSTIIRRPFFFPSLLGIYPIFLIDEEWDEIFSSASLDDYSPSFFLSFTPRY
jgi:hypothetical protein